MNNTEKLAKIIVDFNTAKVAERQAAFMLSLAEQVSDENINELKQKLEDSKLTVERLRPAMIAIAEASAPYYDLLYGSEAGSFVA